MGSEGMVARCRRYMGGDASNEDRKIHKDRSLGAQLLALVCRECQQLGIA